MCVFQPMNKQVWLDDIFRVNEENVTKKEMIRGNTDAAKFFIPTLDLHKTNGEK